MRKEAPGPANPSRLVSEGLPSLGWRLGSQAEKVAVESLYRTRAPRAPYVKFEKESGPDFDAQDSAQTYFRKSEDKLT